MDIRLIGVIESAGKVVGYRLMDIEAREVKDVPENGIYKVLESKDLSIEGISIRDNKLIGTNGSLDRYAKIENGSIKGKSPLVIIRQLMVDGEPRGYTVVDWRGNILNASLEDTIKYAKLNGIANGAIKSINNKEFISSISGEYKKKSIESGASNKTKLADTFETTVWNMSQFKNYMDSNNYKYDLKSVEEGRQEILFSCSKATKLKYPTGIITIDDYFSIIDLDVAEIVFPPTIESVNADLLEYLPNLEYIVFQDGTDKLELRGIHSPMSHPSSTIHRVRLPETLSHIKHALSNIERLDEINIDKTQVARIFKCFNRVSFNTPLKLPSTIESIKDSFKKCRGILNVVIPDSIRSISDSLAETDIQILELAKCKDLVDIDYKSFQGCDRLEKVTLPEGLLRIGFEAFSNCTNLREVNFPESLEAIRDGAFNNTKIQEVTLGSNIKSIGKKAFSINTKIKFSDTVKVLQESVLSGCWQKDVVLGEGIQVISHNAFNSMKNISSIKIPKRVEKIGSNAFDSCTNLKNIDTSECDKLTYIGNEAFCMTPIHQFVVPDTVEYIGDRAFNKCSELREIVLPKELKKIGRECFKKAGSSIMLGTTFYVYDKSYGLAYCNRNKLRYVVINSIDDFNNRLGGDVSNNKGVAKIKLILGGSKEHQELFKERFIGNADKIYSIYTGLNAECLDKPQLSSKLISFPIDKVEIIDSIYKKSSPYNKTERNKEFNRNNLSPTYISLINMISSVIPLNPAPLTLAGMAYIKEKLHSKPYSIIYSDSDSAIIEMKIANSDLLIVSTIGESIVYVGVVTVSGDMLYDSLFDMYNRSIGSTKRAISEIVSTGTTVYTRGNTKAIINGIEVPSYVSQRLSKRLEAEFIMLEADIKSKKTICLDSVSGKIVICTVKYYYHNKSWEAVESITVLEIKDITELTKQEYSILTRKLNIEEATRKYVYIADKGEYTKSLLKKDDAYDTEQAYEWELGQILGKMAQSSPEDIQAEVYKYLLESELYVAVRKKKDSIRSGRRLYNTLELSDGEHIIQEYIEERVNNYDIPGTVGNYMIQIIGGEFSESSTLNCYMSAREIKMNINMLQKLYIEDKQAIKPVLDDDFISQKSIGNDYILLHRLYYNSRHIILCIGKMDGGIYILAQCKIRGGMYHKILRFKSIKSAMKLLDGRESNTKRESTIRHDILRVVEANIAYLDGDTSITQEDRKYIKLRQEILNGIPNGGYIEGIDINLIDLLAKQHK